MLSFPDLRLTRLKILTHASPSAFNRSGRTVPVIKRPWRLKKKKELQKNGRPYAKDAEALAKSMGDKEAVVAVDEAPDESGDSDTDEELARWPVDHVEL